jgi:SAM-dependent methyltransferase
MASSLPAPSLLDLPLPARHRSDDAAGVGTSEVGSRARALVSRLASRSPEPLRTRQLGDIERIAFHVEQSYLPGGAIADLGGGLGLFTPACAALGMEAFLVDDFADAINADHPIEEMPAHRETGVRIVKSDVNRWGEYFADESLDIVTSFDSIEHWHHSPRLAFLEAYRVLRPGGVVLIGAPNAVNLRKRLSVLMGRSNWSSFDDWYYPEQFRGHVREPVVEDLLRLVDDLGFQRGRIWGRNWAGYARGGMRSRITRMLDAALRLRPSLCSDLYVMAVKPQ